MDEPALRAATDRVVATLGGRRRLVAAALLGIAVLAGLRSVHPATPATTVVWAAARDLTGGAPLVAADIRRLAVPAADVPAGALRATGSLVGRLVAAPMRRGETFTDVRLLGPDLLSALARPGLVAVPVRVADGTAAAALVHAGDRVDVLGVPDPSGAATTERAPVAHDVEVLSVPARAAADPNGDGGGLVVVAVTPAQASALARASAQTRLTLALERP